MGIKFYPFSVQQLKVLTWWCDNSPVKYLNGIIADGAIRSGKTVAMSLSYVMWSMERFNDMNFIMAGKTIKSFERNVLSFLIPMLQKRGYVCERKRADGLIEIRKVDKINHFYIFGGKDESSQDLVQGMTAAGAFFDEVALMPQTFVEQATARCSVTGSKLWFNCNPEGPHHWFLEEWINKREKMKMLYLHFQMEDNLSLTDEVKSRYRSQYIGVFYERYILGLWKAAEGLIYDMFSQENNVIETPKNEELFGSVYISCDYGTVNPTCFLMWQKYKGRWLCRKEYYYNSRKKGRQKTDAEYADDMLAFIDGFIYQSVIVDPSAASFIAELRKRGIKVLTADNDVLDGIRLTAKLLYQQNLIFTKECENTIAEFGLYRWDDKAAQLGEDRPIKSDDHAMDAVRYFVLTILNRTIQSRRRR